MMTRRPPSANDEADRMIRLLDIGIASMRNGDPETALMAVQETLATAKRMPQKIIALPDRSNEVIR